MAQCNNGGAALLSISGFGLNLRTLNINRAAGHVPQNNICTGTQTSGVG